MRRYSAILLACLAASGLAASRLAPAAESAAGGPAPAAKPAAPGTAVGQGEAEALVAAGAKAMQEASSDSSRSVTAAISFSQALRYYQAAGDIDRVCDLEANIFWCKKRMSADDLAHFATKNQGDQEVTKAIATIDAVATKAVPKTEAKAYLDRADRFAKEHPQDFAQQSVRYYEVAERFVGTDISLQAQKLSLEAQQREMQQIKQDHDAERSTLFTRSQQAADSAAHAAVPAADALRAAITTVRQLYKDGYAKTKPKDKRELAGRLLEQVPLSKDDPATQYALLSEAIDLSLASSNWYGVFTACDLMAQCFSGIDAKAKKKEAYARARTTAVVQAILKLLDNPQDADANAVAGRYFCFETDCWDIGLPLLAHGGDHDCAAVASMELLKPAVAPQQAELADRWYEMSAKAFGPAKEAMLERSLLWYEAAAPALTGITKARVDKRLDDLIPLVASAQGIPPGLIPRTTYDAAWAEYHTTFVVKSATGAHGIMLLTTTWGKSSVNYEAPVACDADGTLHIDGKDAIVNGPGKGGYTPDSFTLLPKGALEQFDTSGHHTKGTFTLARKCTGRGGPVALRGSRRRGGGGYFGASAFQIMMSSKYPSFPAQPNSIFDLVGWAIPDDLR